MTGGLRLAGGCKKEVGWGFESIELSACCGSVTDCARVWGSGTTWASGTAGSTGFSATTATWISGLHSGGASVGVYSGTGCAVVNGLGAVNGAGCGGLACASAFDLV